MSMDNIFDQRDIDYLAANLTGVQLRREIHQAEIKIAVAEAYRDTEYQTAEDLWPWADYAAACREAIECLQQNQPKLQLRNGHIDVETIKGKNDIVSIVEQYTKLRKAGRNFTGRCPTHQDKHPSLTVYPDSQIWHCYGA